MFCRLLHDASRNTLGGLGHICRYHLSAINKELPHLCFSTKDVTSRLADVPLGPSSRLLVLDIQDFFMAADHKDLIADVTSHPQAADLRQALQFLLWEQYAYSPLLGSYFQVLKGSGMGTQLSSDVCDLAFFQRVESLQVASFF